MSGQSGLQTLPPLGVNTPKISSEEVSTGTQNNNMGSLLQPRVTELENQLKEETARADRAMQEKSQLKHEVSHLMKQLEDTNMFKRNTDDCYNIVQEKMRELKREVYQQRKLFNWLRTTQPQSFAKLVKQYNDERMLFLEQFYEEHSECKK